MNSSVSGGVGGVNRLEAFLDYQQAAGLREVNPAEFAAGVLQPNHNEPAVRARGLKVRTNVQAGVDPGGQHNEAVVRAHGLKVQTSVQAGIDPSGQHNEAVVRARGLKVQTSVQAGGIIIQD
jgi:hypothetical protein